MENDLFRISRIINKGDSMELEKLFVHIWIGFLGPRDVYRELKLRPVDDKTEFMAIFSMRIEIDGQTFLNNIVAFEVNEGVFVERKMFGEENVKIFLERVRDLKYPRVIFGKKFREDLGLPSTTAEYEARVVGIGLLE